jgi:hypothetical protein
MYEAFAIVLTLNKLNIIAIFFILLVMLIYFIYCCLYVISRLVEIIIHYIILELYKRYGMCNNPS